MQISGCIVSVCVGLCFHVNSIIGVAIPLFAGDNVTAIIEERVVSKVLPYEVEIMCGTRGDKRLGRVPSGAQVNMLFTKAN